MKQFDSVIIGAGMGGMCAAARLTAAGHRVLVVEKSPHLGGRCSHRRRGPYTVTTGAIMIPMGPNSAIREAFDLAGASMDMVELTGRMRYRLEHGDYDLPESGGGLLGMIQFAHLDDEKRANELFQNILDALGSIPGDEESFRDWLDRYTSNGPVKKLFQGFCAALMGTNLHEIPAGEFFRFLKYSSRGSRFGMARLGNGDMMETLALAIQNQGAEIWRSRRCCDVLTSEGRATGVRIRSAKHGDETINCKYVLSNVGPAQTISLVGGRDKFDPDYLAELDAWPHDAPIFHVSFVTNHPLIEGFDGCLVFGNNDNLIYLEIPSLISPSLSPEGKYLHTAYGAPTDAATADLKGELRNTIAELRNNFPGQLDDAEFLVRARHAGASPGMHRWAGRMMPVTTSIKNLFNVGDGATPPGTIGTEGAAASARSAVAMILRQRSTS